MMDEGPTEKSWGQLRMITEQGLPAVFDFCGECVAKIAALFGLELPTVPEGMWEATPPILSMLDGGAPKKRPLVGALTDEDMKELGLVQDEHQMLAVRDGYRCSCGVEFPVMVTAKAEDRNRVAVEAQRHVEQAAEDAKKTTEH